MRWSEIDLPAAIIAIALGTAGGFLARALGLPLPMLLGSILTIGGISVAGIRIAGRPPGVPVRLRMVFIPVIGVSIGSALTPGVLGEIGRWWPSLLALVAFIPLAHLSAFAVLRRLGGLDARTAFWGSVPGGLVDVVLLAEKAEADTQMVTMLQFLRLILCIIIVPLGFTLATGQSVGSGAGVVIGKNLALLPRDWVVLGLTGLAGVFGGRLLRLPAYWMTGPILASGLVHIAGFVRGAPPGWLIDLTQLVIGVSLGTRFIGMEPRKVLVALRLAAANVTVGLLLAAVFSAALAPVVGERWEAVLLSLAPGGLAEMSLVALSLGISVIYVTLHHIARIILAVAFARIIGPRLTEV